MFNTACDKPYRARLLSAGVRSCYSGLQVQGTATTPSSTVSIVKNLYPHTSETQKYIPSLLQIQAES